MDSITTQRAVIWDEDEETPENVIKEIIIQEILNLLKQKINTNYKNLCIGFILYNIHPDVFGINKKLGLNKKHFIIINILAQIIVYIEYNFSKNVKYSTKSLENLQQLRAQNIAANMLLNQYYYSNIAVSKVVTLYTIYNSDSNKILKSSAYVILTKNLFDEYKTSNFQKYIISPMIQRYYDKNMSKLSIIKNAAKPLLQHTDNFVLTKITKPLTEAMYDLINPLIQTICNIL